MEAALDPRAHILARIEAFRAATGMSERQLGVQAAHNPGYVARIRRGMGASLTVIERVETYMRADLAARGLPDLDTLSRS